MRCIARLGILVALGCGTPSAPGLDAGGGPGDAGMEDASPDGGPAPPDAGPPDAGPIDAGPIDAGPIDAGPPVEVTFVDVAEAVGLTAPHNASEPCLVRVGGYCQVSLTAGGAAVGDIDDDGWPDLLLTRMDGPPRLYRNVAGTFEEVTADYGLDTIEGPTNGAAFGDVDNDGDLDLYLTTINDAGPGSFIDLRREGDVFVRVDRGASLASRFYRGGFSAAFGDYDRDGHLDLHVNDWVVLEGEDPPHTRLLRNLGDGAFEDVTASSGATPFPIECWRGEPNPSGDACFEAKAFASAFVDMDFDGHPDLLSVRDFRGSRLFWNDGDGTFTDGTEAAAVGTDDTGMGSTVGDVDGDGDLDWFIACIGDPIRFCGSRPCMTGFTGNRLYRYEGGRRFLDVTDEAGVRTGGWGWGAAFVDFENDGDLDLVQTNGYELPDGDFDDVWNDEPMMAWENDGTGRFTLAPTERGFADTSSGKGLLLFDYDRDGDQDVLVVANLARPRLFENRGGNLAGRWLRVRARPTVSAPGGRGVQVRVWRREGDAPLLRLVDSISHFLGQSERVAHFGLGPGVDTVARLEVRWPSGRVEVREAVATNRVLVVDEADATE
jgi:hypothetical protein